MTDDLITHVKLALDVNVSQITTTQQEWEMYTTHPVAHSNIGQSFGETLVSFVRVGNVFPWKCVSDTETFPMHVFFYFYFLLI